MQSLYKLIMHITIAINLINTTKTYNCINVTVVSNITLSL